MAGSGNTALAFGALLGGAVVIDYGIKSVKKVGGSSSSTGSSSSGSASNTSSGSGYGTAAGSIQSIAGTAGQSVTDQISAIENSGWASSHYHYSLGSVYDEIVGGTAQLSSSQTTFANTFAQDTGLNLNVVKAWLYAEQGNGAGGAPNGANNWLNIGSTDSGFYGGSNPAWSSPVEAAHYSAWWMSGGKEGSR